MLALNQWGINGENQVRCGSGNESSNKQFEFGHELNHRDVKEREIGNKKSRGRI